MRTPIRAHYSVISAVQPATVMMVPVFRVLDQALDVTQRVGGDQLTRSFAR